MRPRPISAIVCILQQAGANGFYVIIAFIITADSEIARRADNYLTRIRTIGAGIKMGIDIALAGDDALDGNHAADGVCTVDIQAVAEVEMLCNRGSDILVYVSAHILGGNQIFLRPRF